MPLATGTSLGPYQIAGLIDTGGMGEVYRARDLRLGREVAVKVIRERAGASDEALLRFDSEARLASRLSHPNILAIYDVGSHDSIPYIVMELLEGETLAERLLRGPLGLKRSLETALPIASGLAAAHARGVIHRDLKPSNVFLTKDGQVKILDFGLAHSTVTPQAMDLSSATTSPELGAQGRIIGTAAYMSPEQVRGEPGDHRSDIFSFGLVLYEILTGKRAFPARTAVEAMAAILKNDPQGLEDGTLELSPDLERVLRHCLEKSPDARFQSARDLAFHLGSLSDDTSSSVRPLATSRRRGLRVPALVVAGVALLGMGGRWLYRSGERAGRADLPRSQPLTFRRGMVTSARFTPDGQTVVYGAAWDGKPIRVFTTRPGNPESRDLGFPDADVLSVSRKGELALSLGRRFVLGWETRGTLARVPLDGGAPRELLTDVESSDWAPNGEDLAVVRVVDGRYRLEYPIGTALYQSRGWLSRPRVSPDGERVAFIEHPAPSDDLGDVCVISRQGSRQVLARGFASVSGLAWPGAAEVWFSAAERGSQTALRAVDLRQRQRVVWRATSRLELLDVRDGRVLLADSRLRLRLALRDSAEGSPERELSWLDGSVGAHLSDDGATLLFSELNAGTGTRNYDVYLRQTDGSPAIRLGEGLAAGLSPDGLWAAAIVMTRPPSVALYPTRSGQPRTLERGGLEKIDAATWFPDGQRLLLSGSGGDGVPRLYLQDVRGGPPRALSPPGVEIPPFTHPISPDGSTVAARDRDGRLVRLSVEDGVARVLGDLEGGLVPLRWSPDGRGLYVLGGEGRREVARVDLGGVARRTVARLAPSDPAGTKNLIAVQMTPDARMFAYSYSQTLSDLHLVEGLR